MDHDVEKGPDDQAQRQRDADRKAGSTAGPFMRPTPRGAAAGVLLEVATLEDGDGHDEQDRRT